MAKTVDKTETLEKLPEFDYAALDSNTQTWLRSKETEIAVLALQVQDLAEQYSRKVLQVGERLTQVRDRLSHNRKGGFEAWVRARGLKMTAVYGYMAAYARFGDCPNFAEFDISPSAIWMLSAASMPEEVRRQAIARAEGGEAITPTVVRAIAGSSSAPRSKPEPKPEPFEVGEEVQVRSGQLQGQVVKVNRLENEYALVELPQDGSLMPVFYSEFEAEERTVIDKDCQDRLGAKMSEPKANPPAVASAIDRVEGMEARLRVEQERGKLLAKELEETKQALARAKQELAEEMAFGDAVCDFLESIVLHLPQELQVKAKEFLGES